jgi:hypothetical protein
MREKKKLKRPLTFAEEYRSQKRLKRRSNTMAQTDFYRQKRIELTGKKEADKQDTKIILSGDRKNEKPDKKLTVAQLERAFSFIPYSLSQYDKRQEIPTDYRPRSFSETR